MCQLGRFQRAARRKKKQKRKKRKKEKWTVVVPSVDGAMYLYGFVLGRRAAIARVINIKTKSNGSLFGPGLSFSLSLILSLFLPRRRRVRL